MPAVSRLTDIWTGICCCHSDPTCISMTGYIITCSPNHISAGFGVARLTDITIGGCGHTGQIITGSTVNITNGLAKAMIGSQVTGCNIGTVVTGAPNHITGLSGRSSAVNLSTVINGVPVTYTEVDFGNVDDESEIDDGLNIYPPVVGRSPTTEEIKRSEVLDVSPTTEVAEDSTASPPVVTPSVTCLTVPDPAPLSFVLSPNFTLGRLSREALLSKISVRAQHGLLYNEIICNLQAWAENIGEPLVSAYGNIFVVTSGFRIGNSTSQHERGQAADIQFLTYTNEQVYNIAIYIRDNLNFDQMILEYGGNKPWIHVSFNRSGNRSASASNKFGTRVSAGNYQWGRLIYMT
jgi:uncharacterized Zn-binding protein involved in type VI secretion